MKMAKFITNRLLACLVFVVVGLGFLSLAPNAQAVSSCRIISGHSVSQVQKALNSKYSYGLAVDGALGPKTCSAIKNFQQRKGLTVDGVVGPATAKTLGLSGIPTSLKCNYGYTSCFIAQKTGGYQGRVYVIYRGQLKATYSAVFGGSGHGTPNGTSNIYFSRNYAHTSTKYPSDEPNMNYPVYFNGAIAIHGSYGVPDSRGSHGCVRVAWSNGPKVYNWYKNYGIKQVIVR
jgi:hypothetical protein